MFEKIVVVGFMISFLYYDYKKSITDAKSKKIYLCFSGVTVYLGYLFFSEKNLINLDDLFAKTLGPIAELIVTSLQP